MKELLEFIKTFDIHTLVGTGLLIWYFTKDIKKELSDKIDLVDRDLKKMNTRIGRMEGTVYGKDLYTKVEE